jgi:hypothetical protein
MERVMRLLPLFAAICGVAAACSLMPPADHGAAPSSLLDAYCIAHGMALSYAGRPDADKNVVHQLSQLDATAANDVQSMVHGGSSQTTAQAIAALTNLAASQPSDTP